MKSISRTYIFLGVLLILVLAAMACSTGTSEPTPAQPKGEAPAAEKPAEEAQPAPPTEEAKGLNVEVQSVKLLRDNGSGEPGDEVQAFAPSDRKMHFEVTASGMLPSGSTVKWTFVAVDTTEGKNIEITSVETKLTLANILTAQLELPRDWPVGTYKADVYVDKDFFTTVNYSVE